MAPVVGFNAIRDAWGAQDLGVQEMVVHRDVQECAGSVLSGVPSIIDPDWQNVDQTFIFGGLPSCPSSAFHCVVATGAFEFTLTFGVCFAGEVQ